MVSDVIVPSSSDLARPSPSRPRRLPLGAVGAGLLAVGVLVAPLQPELRIVGALALFVGLPGYLFVAAIWGVGRGEPLERWLLGLGCGYALAELFGLALYGLFRPLGAPQIVLGALVLNGALLAASVRRGAWSAPAQPAQRRRWATGPLAAILLLVVVAAPLRLWNLGYSEFQGDEGKVALRAFAVLEGLPDPLLAHRKPPGEIVLTALDAGAVGVVTELTARLPFAVAAVAVVLAIDRLGQVMFGPRAGLVAGLLLAVNGYFVAFGRIAQYQSVGFLLDALTVLCLYRFVVAPAERVRYAVTGALLLAGAVLTATSGLFLLPVAALAVWSARRAPGRVGWREMAVWLWPLALLVPIGLALLALLAGRSGERLEASTAWLYLQGRLGAERLYFNLDGLLVSVNHYTSSPYLLLVGGAGLVAVLAGPRRRSLGWALALAWLGGPLIVHLFLWKVPGTHWREIFPGLVLLVGALAAAVDERLASRPARLAAITAGGLFLAASAHYVYVAWIQPWPEYQTVYPAARHPLDWSGRTRVDPGGVFGLAHYQGWKAVAVLIADGQLPPEYGTRERAGLATWYLKRPPLCPEEASLIVRAPVNALERRAIETGATLPGYSLVGRVLSGGRPTLALLVRRGAGGPTEGSSQDPTSSVRDYRAEDFEARFDRELAAPVPVDRLYWPELLDLPRTCD